MNNEGTIENNPTKYMGIKEQSFFKHLAIVKQNGLALKNIKEQNLDICLAAVTENGAALEYVIEQTPEICMIAISNYSFSIAKVDKNIFKLNKTPDGNIVVAYKNIANDKEKSNTVSNTQSRVLTLKYFLYIAGVESLEINGNNITEKLLYQLPQLKFYKARANKLSDDDYSLAKDAVSAINKIKETQIICYIPTFSKSNTGAITASRFGGIPYLSKDEDWPICGNCHQPMSFGAQLNFEQFPELQNEFSTKDIFQFFACSKDCETNLTITDEKSILMRFVDGKNEQKKSIKSPVHVFRSKLIAGWDLKFDYPSDGVTDEIFHKDFEEFTYDIMELNALLSFEIFCPDYEKRPIFSEKINGWYSSHYQEDGAHPSCPKCKKRMLLLLSTYGYPRRNDGGIYCPDEQKFSIFMCKEHHDHFDYQWFNVN